jgi:hypothetical protein
MTGGVQTFATPGTIIIVSKEFSDFTYSCASDIISIADCKLKFGSASLGIVELLLVTTSVSGVLNNTPVLANITVSATADGTSTITCPSTCVAEEVITCQISTKEKEKPFKVLLSSINIRDTSEPPIGTLGKLQVKNTGKEGLQEFQDSFAFKWTAGSRSGKTKLGSAMTGYKTVTIISTPKKRTLITCASASPVESTTMVCHIVPHDRYGTVYISARTLVMSISRIQGPTLATLVPEKLDDDNADDTPYNKFWFNFTTGSSIGLASIRAKTLDGTFLASYNITVVGTPDDTSSTTCTEEGATALAWAPCTIIPRRKGVVIYAAKSSFRPQLVGDGDGEIGKIDPDAGTMFEFHVKSNIFDRNLTVTDELAGSVDLLTHPGGNAYPWGASKTFEVYPYFTEATAGQAPYAEIMSGRATLPELPAWDASIVGSAGVGKGVTTKERFASMSCGEDACAFVMRDGQIMTYDSLGRSSTACLTVVLAMGVVFRKVILKHHHRSITAPSLKQHFKTATKPPLEHHYSVI